ncbi:uncharacterized protein BDW47DRAFT_93080 [Aspergillus candidus]|uniref:Uncharacterized protein n=1 Tax=Aspergillus candidus TaxID=41067 RepID=A0A2I2FHV2_ASPCN|nr:hypothetical protein BDW47DRAFT_93080 [Aspergillus candidus]PLB40194.1 hypothetical protein BDW47DRAFT_93080 [Aspergillus candidus]
MRKVLEVSGLILSIGEGVWLWDTNSGSSIFLPFFFLFSHPIFLWLPFISPTLSRLEGHISLAQRRFSLISLCDSPSVLMHVVISWTLAQDCFA